MASGPRFFLFRFTDVSRVRLGFRHRNGRHPSQVSMVNEFSYADICMRAKSTCRSTLSLPYFGPYRTPKNRGPELSKNVLNSVHSVSTANITTSAALYLQPFKSPVDLSNQSQEAPGIPYGKSSLLCKDGKPVEYLFGDLRTFYDAFKRGARISRNGNCLGWKASKTEPYQWLSYNQVIERAEFIGSGFINIGIQPSNTSRIGIFCSNTPEFVITDLACATYSMVLVPLYDTLGPDICTIIINQADIKLVLCDTPQRVQKLLANKSQTPNLKTVICFHCVHECVKKLTKDSDIEVVTFEELENLGRKNHHKPKPCVPSDLSTICYTSGTTGIPKGAMITHRNLIASLSGIMLHFVGACKVSPEDVYLSYLPLPHIYEKVNQAFLYSQGCQVGFFQGDMLTFLDDIRELRPTVFATVPRLLNRLYAKFMAAVSKNYVTHFLYQTGYNSKLREVQRGIIRRDSVWDKLIFHKVQESLGGRIRTVISGSAPLSPNVVNFTRVVLGCVVMEAYGLTESTSVVTAQIPGDSTPANVGPPFPTNIVKIIDIPEMNYFAKNQQGEVCIKGANVFVGYLNEPEKTAEVLDKDGWLHTGDVGMWQPNGTLKIIDRQKNFFKLAKGEYIAPEKIENIYMTSEIVGQVMIYGDTLKASVIGVVVPNPEELCQFVKKKLNIECASMVQLCARMDVKQAIFDDMLTVGKNSGLMPFEQVKDIHLAPELFSIENEQLTPTQKIKRSNIRKCYAQSIEKLYSKLD